jgi:hypothetical protein
MKNGQLKLVVQFSRSHLACARRRRARNSDFYNISHPPAPMQVFFRMKRISTCIAGRIQHPDGRGHFSGGE